MRTIDKKRLVKKIGKIKKSEADKILEVLQEMFTN
jgi:mRNA-degrading endonuclease toxin of MazEF toxin-antitoxin module